MEPGEEQTIRSGGGWAPPSAPSPTSPLLSQGLYVLRMRSVCPTWPSHRQEDVCAKALCPLSSVTLLSISLLHASLTQMNNISQSERLVFTVDKGENLRVRVRDIRHSAWIPFSSSVHPPPCFWAGEGSLGPDGDSYSWF